jgi:hypothetical protein
MRCTVDSDMGNDTSLIGCDAIAVPSVQLDLVNTQDLAADAWVAPKQTDQMVIPKGIIQPLAYTNLVKQRSVAFASKQSVPQLPPMNLPQPKSPQKGRQLPQQQVGCNTGLVNIGGECLPPLRR